MAYYQVEPWGEGRADLRAGIVAAAVANWSGLMKPGGKPATAGDYMPFLEQPEAKPSAAAFRAMFAPRVKKRGSTK